MKAMEHPGGSDYSWLGCIYFGFVAGMIKFFNVYLLADASFWMVVGKAGFTALVCAIGAGIGNYLWVAFKKNILPKMLASIKTAYQQKFKKKK
jgi:hypothetical protein